MAICTYLRKTTGKIDVTLVKKLCGRTKIIPETSFFSLQMVLQPFPCCETLGHNYKQKTCQNLRGCEWYPKEAWWPEGRHCGVNDHDDVTAVRAVMFAVAYRQTGVRQRLVEAGLGCVCGGALMEPTTRDTLALCVTGDRVLLANPQIGTSAHHSVPLGLSKYFRHDRQTCCQNWSPSICVNPDSCPRPHRLSTGVTQRESRICCRPVEESGGSYFMCIDFNVFHMSLKAVFWLHASRSNPGSFPLQFKLLPGNNWLVLLNVVLARWRAVNSLWRPR